MILTVKTVPPKSDFCVLYFVNFIGNFLVLAVFVHGTFVKSIPIKSCSIRNTHLFCLFVCLSIALFRCLLGKLIDLLYERVKASKYSWNVWQIIYGAGPFHKTHHICSTLYSQRIHAQTTLNTCQHQTTDTCTRLYEIRLPTPIQLIWIFFCSSIIWDLFH